MHPDNLQFRKRQYEDIPQSESSFRGMQKRGRGKGALFGPDGQYVPTTEFRIPVDVNAFPPDVNIIVQLLGPRGRLQQKMKNDSDAIVTTTGKGVRGQQLQGDEPLALVIRSKDPTIPLTQRQIAVVYQTYEDILNHVREYGTSDNAGNYQSVINQYPPMSVMELLWNLHQLLSRPRPSDLRVDDLYKEYSELFGHDCPIASWLVVDAGAGGLLAALQRISHVVEVYQQNYDGPWYMRAANPPDFNYSQLREVDDVYKIRLQQIAAGKIPLEDLANASGITGMLFGLERVSACVNVMMAIIKLVGDKSTARNPMDIATLKSEFFELYKIQLDVFNLLNEKSLLLFLLKFKMLFNIFHDGISWKILVQENINISEIENIVKSVILVQPSSRKIVKLSQFVPLPRKGSVGGDDTILPLVPPTNNQVDQTTSIAPTESKPQGTDSIAALVSILQGFQKQQSQPTTTAATATSGGDSVSAQIQQLLLKKKQETAAPATAKPAASGTALNELMAALQAAKNK